MKEERKKLLNYLLLTTLIISAFVLSVQVVSAADTVIGDLFSNLRLNIDFIPTNFTEAPGFAQFLFFLLITLIVFGISEAIPFLGRGPGKTWIAFSVSIIVGILSALYLDNTQVYSILLSYNALGITLSAILPAIIILALSIQLYKQGYFFFSKIVWLVFGIILFFRWAFASPDQIGSFGRWVYPIVFLGVLVLFFFDRKLYKLILSQEMNSKIDALEQHLEGQRQKREAEYESVMKEGKGRRK